MYHSWSTKVADRESIVKRTFIVFFLFLVGVVQPALAQEGVTYNAIRLTARKATFMLDAPRLDAAFVRAYTQGAIDKAFRRDEAGEWLQVSDGWVVASVFQHDGDIDELPDISNSVTGTIKEDAKLYTGPSTRWFDVAGNVEALSFTVVIGRNEDGMWIQLPGGWMETANISSSGNWLNLPVIESSAVVITAKQRTFILAKPDLSAEFVDVFEAGEEALAIGQAGDWLQIAQGWVSAEAVKVSGDVITPKYSGDGLVIIAKVGAQILESPGGARVSSHVHGEQLNAVGRSSNTYWLQTAPGWVYRTYFEVQGDYLELPVTWPPTVYAEDENQEALGGIKIVAKVNIHVREAPLSDAELLDEVSYGDRITALGRNESGYWLQTARGWVARNSFTVDGNHMDLPVTWPSGDSNVSTTSSSATSVRATATPRPTATPQPVSSLTASTIRSLVSRHTKDIRILDLDITSSATTIEYDLKPWPFVPNESIAEEVAFKIICALRKGQQIPNTLKLIGQGHFKSDIGRKFKSPSVEIHIRASNANRIVCGGNDYSDINWRSVSSVYKSYPIPRGASVDYD